MYIYLLGITLLKSISPYFRKHILDVLTPHDMLYLNTLIISLLVLGIFIFTHSFDNKKSFKKTLQNYKKLSLTQTLCIIIICVLGIISTLIIFDLDKNFNTPLLNFLFIRCGSIILLVLIGGFFFGEKYNLKQIFGIMSIVLGVYLVSSDKIMD